MTEFNEPIRDITQAKVYFQTMGCSHFHMSREYPERYNEYKSKNISKSQEQEWTKESFLAIKDQIVDQHSNEEYLWSRHSEMVVLAKSLKSEEAVKFVRLATLQIIDRLHPKSCLLVAETIIGRQHIEYRDGMIFLAYDLSLKDIAKEFSDVALQLVARAKQRQCDPPRCDKAQKDCNRIVKHLGI